MNTPAAKRPPAPSRPTRPLPPGPLTTPELEAAGVGRAGRRAHYRRLWHGMYRRADQPDDLRMRSMALAGAWPEGVLRGRSAALIWGDDSAPEGTLPEIWLPTTRKASTGRIYRYGSMPASSVTTVDGLRVTTPLRTSRDLALDLPFDDAVVAVEAMCAVVPELPAVLRAAHEHPAGRGRGGRAFAAVAGAVDTGSGSASSTLARLALRAAGCGDFRHGHTIRLGTHRIELPLADPTARCVVLTPGGLPTPRGWVDPARSRMQLRRAGWTVIVARGDAAGAGGTPGRDSAPTSDRALVQPAAGAVGDRAAQVLRTRWPATEVLRPLELEVTDDPLGMWSAGGGG